MRNLYQIILCVFLFGGNSFGQSDSSKFVIVGETSFVGNDKTKPFVLLRELAYQKGDTLNSEELEKRLTRSKENLFNTGLFNLTEFERVPGENNQVDIIFNLEERWFVWPYPILENGDRNFNTWWETRDFSRLTYGVFLNWYNFRGRNETFQVMTKLGFENQFSLGYDIPNLNKKKTLGLNVAMGYAEYKEVNYASQGNKRVFYKSENGPGRQVLFAKANITYRKGLNFRHRFGLSYNQIKIDSALTDLSNDYLKNNQTKSEYFTFLYYGKYDTRDYMSYPLKGYKIESYIYQYGLGVFENENLHVTTASLGMFWHVPLGGRWNFANAIVGKVSFGDQTPYAIQKGLGYSNYVRGYELYVMDAERYGVFKTNLKYNLIKKKEMHLKWFPIRKFSKPYFAIYLNAYFDAGFADDRIYSDNNPLSNKWIYGYGLGMDVTGFYDFVGRLEYSFNGERERGLYLHFSKSF